VHVWIEVQLDLPEAFTSKYDRSQIRNPSRGVSDHRDIAGHVDDRLRTLDLAHPECVPD
jgi:hypothetical protein